MAIKSFKPYSASRRFMTVSTFEEITASKPEKSLLAKVTNKGGRNNSGRMTVRHQGGGLLTSLFCSTQMAKRNISSLRTALKLATSFTAVLNRISKSATPCRSRISPSARSYTTLN